MEAYDTCFNVAIVPKGTERGLVRVEKRELAGLAQPLEDFDTTLNAPIVPKGPEGGLVRIEKRELAGLAQASSRVCEFVPVGMPLGVRHVSNWNMMTSIYSELRDSHAEIMVAQPKSLSLTEIGHNDYEAYVTASLGYIRDNLEIFLSDRREVSRLPQQQDEGESLTAEYRRLAELELNQGLSLTDADRLREVERQLNEIDSREPNAVQVLSDYRRDITKLRELNEIAERLRALI
jgi:hypothetical protein